MILPPVVHEAEGSTDPANTTFYQSPFESREAHGCPTPDKALQSVIHLELDNADNDPTGTRTMRSAKWVTTADVHTGHHIHILHCCPERVPIGQVVWPIVNPGREHDAH